MPLPICAAQTIADAEDQTATGSDGIRNITLLIRLTSRFFFPFVLTRLCSLDVSLRTLLGKSRHRSHAEALRERRTAYPRYSPSVSRSGNDLLQTLALRLGWSSHAHIICIYIYGKSQDVSVPLLFHVCCKPLNLGPLGKVVGLRPQRTCRYQTCTKAFCDAVPIESQVFAYSVCPQLIGMAVDELGATRNRSATSCTVRI